MFSEQKSTTLKLILAQTQREAIEMQSLSESMRVTASKAEPPNQTSNKKLESLPEPSVDDKGIESPTISDLPSELMRTEIADDPPSRRNLVNNLLCDTQTENLAMSQVPDHLYMNEDRMIFLTPEQAGQKRLYESVIEKFTNLPIQQKVLLESEQIDSVIELLPYLQHQKEHQGDYNE